jgi:hypothetical protein
LLWQGTLPWWGLNLFRGHQVYNRGQRVYAHLRERCEPVVGDPEKVVEVWADAVTVSSTNLKPQPRSWKETSWGVLRRNVGARLNAVRLRALLKVQEPFHHFDEFHLIWCWHASDVCDRMVWKHTIESRLRTEIKQSLRDIIHLCIIQISESGWVPADSEVDWYSRACKLAAEPL